MNMKINLEANKQKALQLLDKKLAEPNQDTRSGTHSKSHLVMTANLTQLIGKLYKFSDMELFLTYFAALFHDIVRSSSEDSQKQDEKLSAKKAVSELEQFNPTDEEKAAIYYAIINHGKNPSWMENPSSRENSPQSLKKKLHFVLYVADKIEQNGVRVIARRSAFVAGERLHKENGDLKVFGFKPSKDENLVVAIETTLRLTFINPEAIYPKKLELIIKPLYKIQRDFMFGIMKKLNLTVERLAQIILDTRRPDGKNLIAVRNIQEVKDSKNLAGMIEKLGQITDSEIQSASDDLVKSSSEAVEYFGSRFKEDIDQLMLNWKPKNKIAQDWQRKMIEYLDGTWLNSITI